VTKRRHYWRLLLFISVLILPSLFIVWEGWRNVRLDRDKRLNDAKTIALESRLRRQKELRRRSFKRGLSFGEKHDGGAEEFLRADSLRRFRLVRILVRVVAIHNGRAVQCFRLRLRLCRNLCEHSKRISFDEIIAVRSDGPMIPNQHALRRPDGASVGFMRL